MDDLYKQCPLGGTFARRRVFSVSTSSLAPLLKVAFVSLTPGTLTQLSDRLYNYQVTVGALAHRNGARCGGRRTNASRRR